MRLFESRATRPATPLWQARRVRFGLPGWRLAVTACALALAHCGDSPPRERFRSLIHDRWSESRLLSEERALDEWLLDFADPEALGQIRVSGAEAERVAEGLRLRPLGDDPILATLRTDLAFNRVEVEMASAADGSLAVFWAPAGSRFDSEHQKRLEVRRSTEIRRYVCDLWDEVVPVQAGYRFRIDPIDGAHEVTIRSIRLVRMARVPPGGDVPPAGKVVFRGETRSAVALRPGADLEEAVDVDHDDELSFSVAPARDNTVPARLRVIARRGESEVPLWERRFAPGEEPAWRLVRLPLERLRPGRWRIVFSSGPRAEEAAIALVLVAGPRVVATAAPRRRPNVLLISLDTLGAAHLGSARGGASAPFLEGLAAEGALFSDAFSTASITHVSHSSILTGREPVDAGLAWLGGHLRSEASVAEAFRQAGYATAAFTGGVLVSEALGFDQGFELFFQNDTLHNRWARQTDIEELTGRLAGWVEAEGEDRPTFLFLHSYEIHGPYGRHEEALSLPAGAAASPLAAEPWLNMDHMRGMLGRPKEELGPWMQHLDGDGRATTFAGLRLSEDDLDVARAYYHSEISYTDGVLRRLFERLEADGFLDDAIVVVTADHGEAFGEHGLLQHGLLYGEDLHVPLIVWAPERVQPGRRIGTQVSSLDIAPTLLDLAALPPTRGMDGRSLSPLLEDGHGDDRGFEAFVPGNGLAWYTEGREKLVLRAALDQESFGLVELFDLARDPGETENLMQGGAELEGPWRSRVRDTVARLPGLHIPLGVLDPGEYRLEIDGGRGFLETLYAFGLERLAGEAPVENDWGYRCRVRIGTDSRLVVLGDGPQRALTIVLSKAGAAPLHFTISPADLDAGPGRIAAEEGGVALPVLRVGSEATVAPTEGLSEEDRERLRDLGYLQ